MTDQDENGAIAAVQEAPEEVGEERAPWTMPRIESADIVRDTALDIIHTNTEGPNSLS